MNNLEMAKHNAAALAVLKELSQSSKGFSFWQTPRFFVANEQGHNPDGLHFAWPETIQKVNMVSLPCDEKGCKMDVDRVNECQLSTR